MANMSKTREDIKSSTFRTAHSSVKMSFRTGKREQGSCRGNITVIPWTVSAQQGNAISQKENRIVVQEDGYYLVFGQVLFKSPSAVVGHVIPSWSSSAKTCHTAGIVQLHQDEDELELVIPRSPRAVVSPDTGSTFFGVIQLK